MLILPPDVESKPYLSFSTPSSLPTWLWVEQSKCEKEEMDGCWEDWRYRWQFAAPSLSFLITAACERGIEITAIKFLSSFAAVFMLNCSFSLFQLSEKGHLTDFDFDAKISSPNWILSVGLSLNDEHSPLIQGTHATCHWSHCHHSVLCLCSLAKEETKVHQGLNHSRSFLLLLDSSWAD